MSSSQGEINQAPVPQRIAGALEKTGLRVYGFYENITSRRPPERPLNELWPTRRFSFFCLTQLIGGDGYWRNVETGEFRELVPGDWMLVTPAYAHSYGAYRERFTEDSVWFDGPVVRQLERDGLLRCGVLHLGRDRRLLPVIRDLRSATLPSMFKAYAGLLQLLTECFAGGGSPDAGGEEFRVLDALLEKVQNSRDVWTVEELAEYCNWSANHFRRRFRERTGMNPKLYLEQLRMNRAAELLCSTRRKICDVARELKFEDSYYFCRRFREQTGMTPSAYRKKFTRFSG